MTTKNQRTHPDHIVQHLRQETGESTSQFVARVRGLAARGDDQAQATLDHLESSFAGRMVLDSLRNTTTKLETVK